MLRLELTSQSPAENLAIDEALLEAAEAQSDFPQLLRVWEPSSPMVVLGRSSPAATEVDLPFCEQESIPVFRRCSGGQTVVTGPGCLMYALLLDYETYPQLRSLNHAHSFVMSRMQTALATLGVETEMQGTCDLTLGGQKVSGNALRCRRNWLIYHGTFLCHLDLDLIARCLRKPIREPEYRQDRTHTDFLRRIPVTTGALQQAIIQEWQADELLQPATWDYQTDPQMKPLMAKYLSSEWTLKH